MTRGEAIKVLKNTEGNINYDARREEIYFTHEWVGAYEMAISALREQPRWISVEERMPKDGIRVLALHDDGVVRIGISRGYFPAVVSKTHTKAFGITEVTHWMPLPKMPEVEV